jgi:hypothetical protein
MYSRLYQQCHGTSPATSSITKFMSPNSCNYYIEKKQNAVNIIPDGVINIQYNLPCIDYHNLQNDFKKIIENESTSLNDSKANLTNSSDKTKSTLYGNQNPFNPMIWGPAAWKFFTTVAFGYPDTPTDDEKIAAFNFFESLRYLLPCGVCKEHYDENFATTPVNVESRDTLSHWVVDFHNIVNKSLGKPIISYETVAAKYPKEECKSCSIDSL